MKKISQFFFAAGAIIGIVAIVIFIVGLFFRELQPIWWSILLVQWSCLGFGYWFKRYLCRVCGSEIRTYTYGKSKTYCDCP